jgi:hypothetical protein
MTRKNTFGLEETVGVIEKSAISNYVRLCFSEGIKPKDAFKEVSRKLRDHQRT